MQDVLCKVEYYNERQPRRRTTIANPIADVIAPGETVTFDLEYIPPTDQLLGEYKIAVTVDPDDQLKELKEDNNAMESGTIRLSDIRLLLPSDSFVFDENGLFLFQWDSLVFAEFKIQVGVDDKFEDPRLYFDLPQGDRWIADKELVPLTGELPGMAMGLHANKSEEQALLACHRSKYQWSAGHFRRSKLHNQTNLRRFLD